MSPTFPPLVCSYEVCLRRAISPELFIIIIIVIVITITDGMCVQTRSAGHSFSLTTVRKDESYRPHLYEQVRRLSSNPLDLNSNKLIYSSFPPAVFPYSRRCCPPGVNIEIFK